MSALNVGLVTIAKEFQAPTPRKNAELVSSVQLELSKMWSQTLRSLYLPRVLTLTRSPLCLGSAESATTVRKMV